MVGPRPKAAGVVALRGAASHHSHRTAGLDFRHGLAGGSGSA